MSKRVEWDFISGILSIWVMFRKNSISKGKKMLEHILKGRKNYCVPKNGKLKRHKMGKTEYAK